MLFDAIMVAFDKELPDRERALPRPRRVSAKEEVGKLRGARVLVVEDNEINQQVAQEMLEGQGCGEHCRQRERGFGEGEGPYL